MFALSGLSLSRSIIRCSTKSQPSVTWSFMTANYKLPWRVGAFVRRRKKMWNWSRFAVYCIALNNLITFALENSLSMSTWCRNGHRSVGELTISTNTKQKRTRWKYYIFYDLIRSDAHMTEMGEWGIWEIVIERANRSKSFDCIDEWPQRNVVEMKRYEIVEVQATCRPDNTLCVDLTSLHSLPIRSSSTTTHQRIRTLSLSALMNDKTVKNGRKRNTGNCTKCIRFTAMCIVERKREKKGDGKRKTEKRKTKSKMKKTTGKMAMAGMNDAIIR